MTNKTINVRFEIDKRAFSSVQDWLGYETMHSVGNKWIAEVALSDDETLVQKIISLGAGIKVLSPDSLQERIGNVVSEIAKHYT